MSASDLRRVRRTSGGPSTCPSARCCLHGASPDSLSGINAGCLPLCSTYDLLHRVLMRRLWRRPAHYCSSRPTVILTESFDPPPFGTSFPVAYKPGLGT